VLSLVPTQLVSVDFGSQPNQNPLNPALFTPAPFLPFNLQVSAGVCIATTLGEDCSELYTAVSFPNNQFASIVLGLLDNGDDEGVYVRAGVGQFYSVLVNGPYGPTCTVQIISVFGTLATVTVPTAVAGSLLTLSVTGASTPTSPAILTVTLDGVVVCTASDTNGIASGAPGLFIGANASLTNTNVASFAAGSIGPNTSTLTTTLLVPDLFSYAMKYSVLAKCWSKDGETRDPSRAEFCQKKAQFITMLAVKFMNGAGVNMPTGTRGDPDFSPMPIPQGAANA
jgi:hypothetical protein